MNKNNHRYRYAAGGDRTPDITVFSRALSQLSYRGKNKKERFQILTEFFVDIVDGLSHLT